MSQSLPQAFKQNFLGASPDWYQKTIVAFFRKHNLQYSIWRETLTGVNRLLNQWILGVKMRDVNWIKIYKLEELNKIKMNIPSSLVESEICAKLIYNENKLIEVPSKYLERVYGLDKGASFKIVFQALSDTISLALEIFNFKKIRVLFLSSSLSIWIISKNNHKI